jgi:hypothetical protein
MSPGGPKTRVFISYAHKDDSELASGFARTLPGWMTPSG